MEDREVYRKLQEHLDTLPIGFPPTESGVEIRLLKHLFAPDEAEVAAHLVRDPRPLAQIHRRLGETGMSLRELERMLDRMHFKGTVSRSIRNGDKCYQNEMLVLGMWEYQVGRLTKGFVEDLQQYFEEAFDDDLIRARMTTLRTIPVEKSIPLPSEFRVASYDEVRALVAEASDRIAVANCVCRQAQDVIGRGCAVTDMRETCLLFKETAEHHCELGIARPISRQEALRILGKAQDARLVLQPENAEHPQFICCCCGDCCEILLRAKRHPRPAELYVTNYYLEVSPQLCQGCGDCLDICQLDARSLAGEVAVVDLERCIGCGNCVVACPHGACRLRQKETETALPRDSRELFARIAQRRAVHRDK